MIIIEGNALNGALNHISDMAAVAQRDRVLEQSDRENVRLHQHYDKERQLERERLEADTNIRKGELKVRETLAENDRIRAQTYADATKQTIRHREHGFQQGILQTQSAAIDRAYGLLKSAQAKYTEQTGKDPHGKEFNNWLDSSDSGVYRGLNKDIVTLHNTTLPVRKAMAQSAGRVGENAGSSRINRDANGNYVYVAQDGKTGEVIVKTPGGTESSEDPNQPVNAFTLEDILVRSGSALAPYGATPAFINIQASKYIYNQMTGAEKAEFDKTGAIPTRLKTSSPVEGSPEDSASAALLSPDPQVSAQYVADASVQALDNPTQTATADNPPTPQAVEETNARQEADYRDEQATQSGLASYIPVPGSQVPSGAADRQVAPSEPIEFGPVRERSAGFGPGGTGIPVASASMPTTVTPTGLDTGPDAPVQQQTASQALDRSGWSQQARDEWDAANPPATTSSGLRKEPHRNWFGKQLDKVYEGVGTAVDRINSGRSTPVSATGSPPPQGTFVGNRVKNKAAELYGEYPGPRNENEYTRGPLATSPLTQNYGPAQSNNGEMDTARGLLQQDLANTYRQRGLTTSGDFMEGQAAFSLSGQHLSDNPTIAAQQRKALQIKEQQKFEQEFGVPEVQWVPAADGKLVPQETGRRVPTSHGYTQGENFEYHTRQFANSYVRSKLGAKDETKLKRLDKELSKIIEGYMPGDASQIQALVYDVYSSNPEKYFREIPGVRSTDVSTWNNKQKQRLFDVITEELTQPGILGEFFDRIHRASFFNEKIRRNTIPREGLSQGVRADLYKYRANSGEPPPQIESKGSALERLLLPELR